MANLPYPVSPDSLFYPDGPVFLSCGLRIMDVNYGPNPDQKSCKLLNLFAYLFTLILKTKPWTFRATGYQRGQYFSCYEH